MNENIMVDNHYLALSVYVDFIIKLKIFRKYRFGAEL